MELEELKNNWADVDARLQQQQSLNTIVMNDLLKIKYRTGINKITLPEMIGSVICILGALYIVLNFSSLDTFFLNVVGAVSIFLLCLLCALSWLSVRQFQLPADLAQPFAITIKGFAEQRLRFYRFQKINVALCYLLLVCVVILFSKFFFHKSIGDTSSFWLYVFCVGYAFLFGYAKFVKKYYKKALQQTEELLNDLAE